MAQNPNCATIKKSTLYSARSGQYGTLCRKTEINTTDCYCSPIRATAFGAFEVRALESDVIQRSSSEETPLCVVAEKFAVPYASQALLLLLLLCRIVLLVDTICSEEEAVASFRLQVNGQVAFSI